MPLTVLIVDDEQSYLERLVKELAPEGFRFLQAPDGERGFSVAVRRQPDVIVSDWEMPGCTGVEMVKRLAAHPATAAIPVIMATGVMTSSENLQIALEAGAVDYVRKPVEPLELSARVQSAYRLAQARRQAEENAEALREAAIEKDGFLEELQAQKEEIDRQKAEIEQRNRNFRTLVDSLPLMLSIFDKEKRYMLVNEEYAKAAGKTVEEMEGKLTSEVLPEEWLYHCDTKGSKALKEGCEVEFEMELSLSDGSSPAFYGKYVPVVDGEGQVQAVSLFAADVSKLKAAQAELREMNDVKDKLLSVLAHDLRSPIANLSGTLELIQIGALSEGERAMLFGRIGRNTVALLSMLDNLLHWARTQMGGIKTRPRPFDPATLVTEKKEAFAALLEEKRIAFEEEAEAGLTVMADLEQARIVLHNLVGNAVKFSYPEGKVHVQVKAVGGFAAFEVRDQGTGMDAEKLAKLFTRSGVSSSQGTQGEKGTGLGLRLCKEFVEGNGGAIEAESAPGEGSVFRFTLPLASEPEA